jgi:glycosyltransferase involved in cell wall biosynthesis
MIKALLILKEDFPKLKIKVGGNTITENKTFKNKLKLSGYGKYISRLLENNNLKNDIVFLGALSADQMILEYQRAHVFICPSSIENSPNSVGESQLLGTPVIASYVGGIPDMVEDGKTGLLYRFEEIEMLAENIRRIFNNADFAKLLSENAMQKASLRHNKSKNLEKIISIYSVITD